MTTSFRPIAVVGRACVLPGALDPQALWDAVLAGRDLTGPAPAGRWRLDPARVLAPDAPERAYHDRGGYVSGFEGVFDPAGFAIPEADVRALDLLTQWTLHAARQALSQAVGAGDGRRMGAVMGNLSLPSDSLNAYAERAWLDAQGPDFLGGRAADAAGVPAVDPRNRFMSGYPAMVLAQALGLSEGGYALDAACASSLYAIKLACDQLSDGHADLMLAGAANRADDLFLHMGFTALQALSPTGRSRPFHAGADGLLPAEGAAFVALKRLEDAIADGDQILGVIRGVGLANDGRASGLLVPATDGQERALRAAYAQAGWEPSAVGLVECHATGTPVGDATELATLSRVFAGCTNVPIGSLKGNFGHPITVAGLAGLIKLLGAFEAGMRPPGLAVDQETPALRETPFRLLQTPEPWPAGGPRRAALSAFGFGGNDAHLLVEAWDPELTAPPMPVEPSAPGGAIAVVGLGARVGSGQDRHDFAAALFGGDGLAPAERQARELKWTPKQLKFPPADLQAALPQQLWLVAAGEEALSGVKPPARERIGVYAGMQCDGAIARYGVRWRLPEWVDRWKDAGLIGEFTDPWLAAAKEAAFPFLTAAGVLGTLPNVVANRLNSQFDLGGASFAVSEEELSGLRALSLGCRALRAGELDLALVGAVDMATEPVQARAAREALGQAASGDAAIMLALKRLEDAERDGDPVFAVLRSGGKLGRSAAMVPPDVVGADLSAQTQLPDLASRFGHTHAAAGLLQVAAAVLAQRHRATPHPAGAASPSFAAAVPDLAVHVTGMAGAQASVVVAAAPGPALPALNATPALRVYRGGNREAVLAALASGTTFDGPRGGPAALALVINPGDDVAAREAKAHAWLAAGAAPLPPGEGIHYADAPVGGEVAAVFGGAAGAYPGMGRELLLALPELSEGLARQFSSLDEATSWAWADPAPAAPTPLQKLWGSSALIQTHAILTRSILNLPFKAAIGMSSGETNALYAFGAWQDMGALRTDFEAAEVFQTHLGGRHGVLRDAWAGMGLADFDWQTWRVAAPRAEVEAILADVPFCALTMVLGPRDVVIGGHPDACRRALAAIGPGAAIPLGYDVLVHAPEVKGFAEAWHAVHRRPTSPVPGVRFYTHATNAAYVPTADTAADALLGQAVKAIDFPALIEQAYLDGVRVFVEHGPQGSLAPLIKQILGDRPHLAVSLDVAGAPPLRQLMNALAQLVVAGVPVDLAALARRWEAPVRAVVSGPAVTFKGAQAPIVFPAPPEPPVKPVPAPVRDQAMAPAPALPSALAVEQAAVVPEVVPVPVQEVVQVVRSEGAPAPQQAPVAAPVVAPVAGLLEAQRQAHAAYMALMAQQAEVHQRFLAQSAAALQAVLATRAGTVAPAPAPAPTRLPAPSPVPGEGATTPLPPGEGGGSRVRAEVQPIAAPAPVPAPKPVEPPKPAPAPAPPTFKPATPLTPAAPAANVPGGTPVGPAFTREQLEVLASGKISDVFGPLFAQQDGYVPQVRMPEPPLLLADRVTGIKGEAGSMKTGTIWTETDVRFDNWFLHEGRMPAGIMVESGQADLLLISWLGADFVNKGERAYRLLGCELTYHADPVTGYEVLPKPGEVLKYDIHVDGHARQGDIRLFFFHYDCHIDGAPRLTVRHGQAGFFTTEELAASAGVLWDPTEAMPKDGRVDAPRKLTTKRSFDLAAIEAFANGRLDEAFGPGFEQARAHVRSPKMSGGRLRWFEEVTDFDPQGGPWGRGYLRATQKVTPDDWFFDGHFKDDPCMPGTLMFEGTLQTMAFYLAGLGFSLDKDGWRFEPVPEVPYHMRCRGQVTPGYRNLVYEVFVEELHDGPMPTLWADLLVTVDGLKAFHCRKMGIRLVPGFPMEAKGSMLYVQDPLPVAEEDGFAFGQKSLWACAWGKPSMAFGPKFAGFDAGKRLPRLPGPPYHFMTRIMDLDGKIGEPRVGSTVTVDYDVPPDAWYFRENGDATMPYAVLLEAALQPCGWLASFIGVPLRSEGELFFRNLDGTSTQHQEVTPATGTIRTQAKLTKIAQAAGMVIVGFEVACTTADGQPLYDMTTVFGFFPGKSLAAQVGIPATPEVVAAMNEPSDFRVDVAGRYTSPALAPGMLRMIDRVTGWWPEGGKAGLGRARSEKDVDPSNWYFQSHFFQDPVQPGSLGIEAMIQLLQAAMVEKGLAEGFRKPRFEAIAIGKPMTWQYRGQVVPTAKQVVCEIDLVDVGRDERGAYAMADAWLWVDGMRIYGATGLGMRIVEGDDLPPKPPGRTLTSRELAVAGHTPLASGSAEPSPALPGTLSQGERDVAPSPGTGEGGGSRVGASPDEEILDPDVDTWVQDHKPTYVIPVLPFMSLLDRLAAAAAAARPGEHVVGLTDVQVLKWVALPGGPLRLRRKATARDDGRLDVAIERWWDAPNPALSRFEPVATGVAETAPAWPAAPAAWAPPADAKPAPDPYAAGDMFHGPAFQILKALSMGAAGASAVIEADSEIPLGHLNQALLDAMTHAIPSADLHRWAPDIAADDVGYPSRILSIRFHGTTPVVGPVRCEVRFEGFHNGPRFPKFALQLIVGEAVWAELELVYILFPKGPLGSVPGLVRQAFLAERVAIPELGLARADGEATRLTPQEVRGSDWLPGTLARLYRAEGDVDALTRQIAVKEHVARRHGVHPGDVQLVHDGLSAILPDAPLTRLDVELTVSPGGEVTVADAGPGVLDVTPVRDYWRQQLGMTDAFPPEDLYYGLAQRYVAGVRFEDAEAYALARGRGALYVANHQVGIESLLFSLIVSALGGVPSGTLAKAEHKGSWLGRLIAHHFAYPGVADPELIHFFDRQDPASLPGILMRLGPLMAAGKKSLMIHVDGTRAVAANQPVQQISAALLDMAMEAGVPVIPVRFVGGLPTAPVAERLEFPVGHGAQTYWIGRPIWPDDLRSMGLAERKRAVLEAINRLGPAAGAEQPARPDEHFQHELNGWRNRQGLPEVPAVMFKTLEALREARPQTAAILAAVRKAKAAGGLANVPGFPPDGADAAWVANLAAWLAGEVPELLKPGEVG